MSTLLVEIRETSDLEAVRCLGLASGLEDSGTMDGTLFALGAFLGSRLVGAVTLQQCDELATVNWLAVDVRYRGRGVAGRLYAALEREATLRRVRRLWVTARAPGFFVAQGFVPLPAGTESDRLLGECRSCPQFRGECTPQALSKALAGEAFGGVRGEDQA